MYTRSLIASCSTAACLALAATAILADDEDNGSGFRFTPLAASAPCIPGGAGAYPNEQPFLLPPGFTQVVIAREGDGGSTDNWDMQTLNETGPQAGRLLFRTHEVLENGQVTVTDLRTNTTRVLAQRIDWNRLDGIVWTPWQTLLIVEEMRPERTPSMTDPGNPQALAGLVFEVNPRTGASVARPALGAKAHEGIRFDSRGNIYGISETAPTTVVPSGPRPGGYIFKFTPDRRGDLSSGQLYALKIVRDAGDRTGDAVWLPLDRDEVQIDADAAATRAGATGYGRPEDVETATSTGNDRNPGENLYVAVTDESRVLKVLLNGRRADDDDDDDDDDNDGRRGRRRDARRAFVSDYVRQGVNAPVDFTNPDNLALDKAGNLYITEDTVVPPGMDVWMAPPNPRNPNTARMARRFASLTDCTAEPSGVYFDLTGRAMYIHTLHRAGMDLSVRITQDRRRDD
jgi:uncharacterized protein